MSSIHDAGSAENRHLHSAEAHGELGNSLAQQGKIESAIASYQTAIGLNPELAIVHNNLGNLLLRQGKFESAIASYQTAIRLEPKLAMAHSNLGNLYLQQGNSTAAIASYQTALHYDRTYHRARLGLAIAQIPVIYSNEAQIAASRHGYRQQLQELAKYYQTATAEERVEAAKMVGSNQPFYLAYQGLNDRYLQQTYGMTIHQLMASRYPQWSKPLAMPKLAADQKIRIGFFSGFFYRHSVWKIPLRGWVENLDRSKFELFGYYGGSIKDDETVRAARAFERFEHQPRSLAQWAEKIASDNLHLLIFPEFGMNPLSVKLGCLRLAPVQITSWGHPDTSGLPTIDYYLSSELMEPADAESHYTEQLIKLPNLGIHYQPLLIQPKPTSKPDLGLREDEIMFWCCQSLYKYLPQHDDVFPRIARELSNAKFVFIELESQYANDIFDRRLDRSFAQFDINYRDYCLFLPRLSANAFNGVTAIADIFLDNLSWSGCNTALEATVYNLPTVALAGDLMRSRHTSAILKRMGLEETIAQNKTEYIQMAVRLGRDADYRRQISQQIARNKSKLYGDLESVRALEEFIFKVVNKTKPGDRDRATAAFQLATQHHRANRIEAARQEYLKVLELNPQHAEALYELGVIAQRSSREESIKYFEASVAAQPNFLKGWFSLGNLYQSQGRFSSAETAYHQALRLQPDSAPICNNLGYVLQQQGKWSEAISYYERASQLIPDCLEVDVNWGNALHAIGKLTPEKQAHYAKLNYKLGLQRHRVKDWQTAAVYYRQAILMQSDLIDAHYHLGLSLQHQRKLSEAITCYQRVLQLDANYGKAHYSLGEIESDLGNLEQATANFKSGLKLINPHYAKAYSPQQTEKLARFEVPQIPQGEVTVGDYQFPAIPTLPESESRPFWSVVIPVVNRPEYLAECLASVLAQWTSYGNMEIIVLDNGSEPSQWQIPHDLGREIVRYYRFPQTISLQENWNTAVSLCRGKWIHLLHHDDYVLPEFYSRLQKSLSNCATTVGAAFTGYENINEQRQVIFTQQHNLDNYRGIVGDWLGRIGVCCPLSPPSVVIKRTAYERLGGYKLDLLYTCDWEFYKRVASFYDWWYEPGILAHYREQANSITVKENINGSSGIAHRRAIEISYSYLPAEHRTEITARSLTYHFIWCLNRAVMPLSVGNIEAALCLVKEALNMDRSPEAIGKLSLWLQQKFAVPLLNKLANLDEMSLEAEHRILVQIAQTIQRDRNIDRLERNKD